MASLIDVYKRALESIGAPEDENGFIVYKYIDPDGVMQTAPLSIADRPIVLPHKKNLVAEKLEEVVAFHPLSESVIRGESEVLQKFRQLLVSRFKLVTVDLALYMVEKAVDPKASRQFSPKQKAFFDILADATQNTYNALTKIIEAGYTADNDYKMLNIYLRRKGATFQGQKVTRAAIVSFPFMEAKGMNGKKHTWCGVEVSQKDMRMLTALFGYLVPGIEEPEELYNYGSNDTQAPYFDALIHSFAKLMENLNNIILLLGDKYERGSFMHTDLSWVTDFEPLSQFRGQILSLPFNDGQPLNDTPEPTKQVVEPKKVVNNSVSGAAQPAAKAPEADVEDTTVTLTDLLSKVKAQQPQQPGQWASAVPEQDTSNLPDNAYNRLMATVYKKNGMPIPANGFGSIDSFSGLGIEKTQPASAIRRRAAKRQDEVSRAWSGRTANRW